MYFRIRPIAPLSSRHKIFIVKGNDEIADAYLQEIWDDSEEYDMFNLATEYTNDKRNFPRIYSCKPVLPQKSSIVELSSPGYRFTFKEWNGLSRWEFESLVYDSHKEDTLYNKFFSRDIISIQSPIFHKLERILKKTNYDSVLRVLRFKDKCTIKIYLDYDLEKYQGGNYIEFCISIDMTVERLLIALCEGHISPCFSLTQILYDGPGGMGKKYTMRDAKRSDIRVNDWDMDLDRTMCFLLSMEE